jgi:hypothetical protein
MAHLYFLLALGAWVLLAFLLSIWRVLKRRSRLPYVADEILFTPTQQVFREVLERAVGSDFQVYGRVRVADVIGLQRRISRRDRELAYRRLDERVFDFLICRRDTTAIACAVNLAAPSRLRKQPAKDVLDRICAAAGLPFVRFRESSRYSVEEVAAPIFAAIHATRPPSTQEIPLDEAEDMLQGLSEIILGERQGARPRRAAQTPLGKVRQHPILESPLAGRLAPSILAQEDTDDAPLFRIEGDLDDERVGGAESERQRGVR